MRDQHGIDCPPGHKLVEVRDDEGELIAQFFEVDVAPKGGDALASPRSVAEGDADAQVIADKLGVTKAEAIRRALHMAARELEGGEEVKGAKQ